MSKTLPLVDGYAAQNTKHVLGALRTFERVANKESCAKGELAAIDYYQSMTDKRVGPRIVRTWRKVAASYGGIEKTPANAFGALKSCAHVKRPVLLRLRQLQKECSALSARIRNREADYFINVEELATIDGELRECLASVLSNKPLFHLASIKTEAIRLEKLPTHKFCKYVSSARTEARVELLLKRLRVLAVTQQRKAFRTT